MFIKKITNLHGIFLQSPSDMKITQQKCCLILSNQILSNSKTKKLPKAPKYIINYLYSF